MAQDIVIADLDVNVDDLVKSNSQAVVSINKLKAEQSALRKETNNLTTATDAQAKKYAENDVELKKLNKEYNSGKKILAESTTNVKGLNDVLKQEVTTIAQARKNNELLRNARNNVNTSTESGRKSIDEINKRLSTNNEFIKSNVSELEQQKIGIGSYEQSVVNALDKVKIFGVSIGDVRSNLKQSQEILKQQSKETRDNADATNKLGVANNFFNRTLGFASKGLKLFRLALASTGIGAIVVALGSLVTFLASTQRGMDLVNRAIAPLKAGFQILIGIFQDIGEGVFDAFSGGGNIIENFGNSIRENITNRINGFIDTLGFLGQAIKNTFTLNFDEVGKNIADAGKSALQAGTGIENFADKAGQFFKNTGEFIGDAVEQGQSIADMRVEIEKAENALIISASEYNNILKTQNQIAEDTSNTIAEREAAALASIEASNNRLREEQELLDRKIALKELENSLNDTSREDQKELNELIAQRNQAETSAVTEQTRLTNRLNTIRTQREKEQEQANNKEIENLNNQLALNEAIQKVKPIDDIPFLEQQSNLRLQILEREFENGKKSKEVYEVEKAQIEKDTLKELADLQISNLQDSLNIFRQENELRLQAGDELTDQLRTQENERLSTIHERRKQLLTEQLDSEFITQQQHNEKLLELDNNFAEQKKVLNDERAIADAEIEQEKIAVDFENRLIRLEEENATEYELKNTQLQREQQLELSKLNQKLRLKQLSEQQYNAAVTKLNAENQQKQLQLTIASEQAKLQAKAQVLSGVATAFGEESAIGKAAALASTTINTYAGATKAFLNPGGIPGAILAGTIIATGLLNVSKIAGVGVPNTGGVQGALSGITSISSGLQGLTKVPKAKEGGLFELGGKRHSQGGTKIYTEDGGMLEAEKGEVIGVMNRRASKLFMGFNDLFRTRLNTTPYRFEQGGILPSQVRSMPVLDYDKLAEKIAEANLSLPAPQVVVTDISDALTEQNELQIQTNS